MPKFGNSDLVHFRAVPPGRCIMSISAHEPRSGRLPRDLHPGAWWAWALGMATAASRTTNPLLLALIVAVVAFVVSARRGDAPWASGFRTYIIMAGVVIGIRVVFRMILDGQNGEHVIFTLPEVSLPESAAGIRIGGPVSLEGVLAALYDGMRLGTMLVCLGAANVLANPKRLLKAVPSALYEIGSTVTVALSVAPQLMESLVRVTRARKLRGDVGRRTHWVSQVAVPVMTDALDRSLYLAAAMDSRGYGRTGAIPRSSRIVTGTLLITGMAGICIGVYGLLDSTTPAAMGAPVLIAAMMLSVIGFIGSGSRTRRSRYRPDPWAWPEMAVTVCGVIPAVVVITLLGTDSIGLNPPVQPLSWPSLPVLPALAAMIAAGAAWVSPPVASGGPR